MQRQMTECGKENLKAEAKLKEGEIFTVCGDDKEVREQKGKKSLILKQLDFKRFISLLQPAFSFIYYLVTVLKE